MCGIAGQFGVIAPGFARESLERLRHRGPDGHGVWEGDAAVLIHTRLAILDLSDAGAQPMEYQGSAVRGHESVGNDKNSISLASSTDGVSSGGHKPPLQVLVFNGEIYNHVELRKDLEAQGESFVGHSDTEVLLRLLVREGVACLPKLAGMFAFAFWNVATGEGLLARDSLGIKPLYYRADWASFSFASESQVLRRDDDTVDQNALRDFFLWGSVPEPKTLQAQIRQISAGHWLKWNSGKVAIQQWHSESHSKFKHQNSKFAATHTREALQESIRRHLVSDVPVGIFLSGGIDSTAILALARKELGPNADLRTFSIGFDDPAFDESSMARQTAEHFGTRHSEWRMTPEEGASEIPAFLQAIDQPSIDGFNTWCVSKLARREGMKVVLSGLGGDEWFAGYGSFQRVPRFHRLHSLIGPLRPMAAKLLESRQPGSPWRRLGAFLRGDGTWLEAFHAQRGIFTPEEAFLLVESMTQRSPDASKWQVPNLPKHPLAAVSELEVTRYMRNQLLRDSDVFSMAHGLELRVPFVDVRLADSLRSLPPEIRLRQGKQLLLEAVPEIPEWVKNQPKRGFRFPFQQWMEGQFGELLGEAQRVSPVPLGTWYRTWAVAVAMKRIQ